MFRVVQVKVREGDGGLLVLLQGAEVGEAIGRGVTGGGDGRRGAVPRREGDVSEIVEEGGTGEEWASGEGWHREDG